MVKKIAFPSKRITCVYPVSPIESNTQKRHEIYRLGPPAGLVFWVTCEPKQPRTTIQQHRMVMHGLICNSLKHKKKTKEKRQDQLVLVITTHRTQSLNSNAASARQTCRTPCSKRIEYNYYTFTQTHHDLGPACLPLSLFPHRTSS